MMKRTALVAALALCAGTAQAVVTEMTIYKQPDFRGPAHTVKGEVAKLEGGFAREVSSMLVKGGYWEVCTDDHFKGDCHVLEPGEYPRLDRDLDRRIVSVRFLGADERTARRAAVDQRSEWREYRRDRRSGRAEFRDERRRGRYAQGSVDLYGGPGFRGRSVRVERDTASLRSERFDGRASSVVVNDGTWQLCTEPRFEGVCGVFEPGRYARLAELNDRVSSMRQIR